MVTGYAHDATTQLLLLEYERSSEFPNHVDDVRNVIMSFFMTMVAASAVLLKYPDGGLSVHGPAGAGSVSIAVSCCIFVVGSLLVLTGARPRRVQFQRYWTMNGIPNRRLSSNDRDLIAFKSKDVVDSAGGYSCRRSSGSYMDPRANTAKFV